MDKAFIKTKQILNRYVKHLREKEDIEQIKKLAYEWLIPDEQVNDFIAGKRAYLADIDIEELEYEDTSTKLADEMNLLEDPDFANIIGTYLCRRCVDPEYAARVLQPHKTLQKCLDYIMGKMYEAAKEKRKSSGTQNGRNIGMAVTEKRIFGLADDYYVMDDAKEDAQKKEQARKQFLDKRKKAEEATKNAEKRRQEKEAAQFGKPKKEERKTEKKTVQISIFDMISSDTPNKEGKEAEKGEKAD